jgi:hypothetical protein
MGRIMPEVSLDTSLWVVDNLESRNAKVHLNTQLLSAVGGKVDLSTGESFESDLIVWTAGVKANPFVPNSDLPWMSAGASMPRLRYKLQLATRLSKALGQPVTSQPFLTFRVTALVATAFLTRSTLCAKPSCWPRTSRRPSVVAK